MRLGKLRALSKIPEGRLDGLIGTIKVHILSKGKRQLRVINRRFGLQKNLLEEYVQ